MLGRLELGRPSKMGIIVFGTGEGSYGTEKNFKEHVVDHEGNPVDAALINGDMGFLMQFRATATGVFRYAFKKGEVTRGATEGIFWTSKPNLPDGETGLNIDTLGPNDKLNVYVASSVASQVIEVRIWRGYS